MSITNYQVFFKIVCEANPYLKVKVPLVLKTYMKMMREIDTMKASHEEVYKYDSTIELM